MKRKDIHRHEDYVEKIDKEVSQKWVPINCMYCNKPINRQDLEQHAREQHGQQPVAKRTRRRKGTGDQMSMFDES